MDEPVTQANNDNSNKDVVNNSSSQKNSITMDRKELINTAVRFLNNPKVKPTSSENKKLFLLKKGLTEIEIKEAFKLAGDDKGAESMKSIEMVSNKNDDNLASSNNEKKLVKQTQLSIWSRLMRWIRNIVIAGCLSYTGYKLLIKKYLFNNHSTNNINLKSSIQNTKQNNVMKQDEKLNESINEIRNMLNSIKETVETMNNIIKQINTIKTTTSIANNDETGIKSEIQSIKNLLLSRTQFPSLPTISPILPSWQLESKNNKIESKENEQASSSNILSNQIDETVTMNTMVDANEVTKTIFTNDNNSE